MTRLFDLDATRLEIRGDDARSWLNGQLTCDVTALPAGGSIRGLRLGKNGRILAAVHVLDRPEGLDLVVPRARAEALAEELDRYIIMEDVELHPRWRERVIAVEGAARPPEGSVPGELFGLEVSLLAVGDVAAALAELGATLVSDEEAEALRVAAGWPGAPELDAGLLPQEAGLKGLVSFTKGCYLGQEPVVMLEHRGRAPKRLARLRLERETARGATVTLESGETAGEITSVATVRGEALALALLKRRAEGDVPLVVDGARVLERSWVGEP
jgi:tRNA-modifying protein YgfZ